MSEQGSADAAAIDEVKAALVAFNKALAKVSARGISAQVDTTEHRYLAQKAPTVTASVRLTRMSIEIDERF